MLSFDKVNKIITVLAPDTEITIQNLLNSIREYEDELTSLDIPKIVSCAGKEPLGGGVVVGLTLTLLDDWQLAFEARLGSTYTQCIVSGGNIVATNTNGSIYPTAFTQVLITASSSATQSDLAAIQYASFGGGVSIDILNSNTGTDYPMGNQEYPVNNIPEAVTIANDNGFNVLFIRSSMTINSVSIENFKLIGTSHVNTIITIADSAVCSGITVDNANVNGELDGDTHLVDCSVGSINYVNGHIHHCGLYGTITLAGNKDAVIENCFTIDMDNPLIIDMGGSGQDLAMPAYSGIVTVKNFDDATGEIGVGLVSGKVILDSTITAGMVIITGIALLEDNTPDTVTVITDGLMNKATIAETISESYIHRIYIDVVNGTAGTAAPLGNEKHPVNNLPDAITIAVRENIDRLDISGSLTITTGQDISGYTLISDRSLGNIVTVDLGAITTGTYFENLTISGIMSGSVRYTTCVLGVITNFDGGAKNSLLTGNIIFTGTNNNYLTECDTYVTTSGYVSLYQNDASLNIIRGRGRFGIFDKTSTDYTAIDLVSGYVYVDVSCNVGEVHVGGIGAVGDDSDTGCTVRQGALNNEYIASSVWDEQIEDHVISNTFGEATYQDQFIYNRVYIDITTSNSGIVYPVGTPFEPVNNLADAILIADFVNSRYFHIVGTLTVQDNEDISGFTLISDRSLGNSISVESGATTSGTYFENLTVAGIMDGSVRYTTCVLGAITNFDGGAKNSLLTDDIVITGSGANYFTECDTYIVDSSIFKKLTISNTLVNIIRCRGNYEIAGKTSTSTTAIDLVAGIIKVDADCVNGEVFIAGIAEVIDNSSAGCEVDIRSMSHTAVSENVWDELLTANTHNLPGTAGRRMRTLTSMVIRNENAQGPGIGDNQIQFDLDASALDGAYDPALVSIIAGTGAGQTRLILQYEGSTLTATVDRNWRINPDGTSEYIIISDAGRQHVNEGLAQAGTTTTITLNTSASSDDNAYKGQVVFIRSGQGEDQARRVLVYDGTTKIVTVGSDWSVTPDSTSAYVVLPTATITHKMIADAVFDAEVSDYITSGSYGHELATKSDIAASTSTDRVTVISGSVIYGSQSGDFTDTYIRDNNYLEITEDATNGITVEMLFKVPSSNHRAGAFSVFGRYIGLPTATHHIELKAYNYESNGWETLQEEFMPGGNTSDATTTHEYYERHVDRVNEEIKIRLVHHVTTYNASHVLYLDYMEATFIEVVTAEDIAEAVWDSLASSYTISGTMGNIMNTTNSSGEYDTALDEIKTNLDRVLGLSQENYELSDMVYTTYSGIQLLESSTIRIYSDPLSVGGIDDIIATYNIESEWTADQLTNYKVTKV